ncbi:MAG: radical SAM protein [Candidatus Obscuribacterales bacterium]|jgi:hypothetical protein
MLVTQIHQVEITSRCNLACKYCVHPKMPRHKMDMTREVFEKVLDRVAGYVAKGTQHELNLAGIGESTIHPQFTEFVRMARRRLPHIDLTMATNGVGLTEAMVRVMAEARMRVWVSLHRPEKAGPAIELLKQYGILAGVSADPSIAAVNWAGQINWHVSAAPSRCMWQAQGLAIAWSDGRLGTCSFDGQGTDGVIGTVWDEPETLFVKPYSLCKGCHQTIN